MYEMQVSTKEMEGYDKKVKVYKYSTGTRITVWGKEGTKKQLFEFDAGMSQSIAETEITVIWTFNKEVFSIAKGNSQRFSFIESHFF